MSKVPFRPFSADDGPAAAPTPLEVQLETVFEREGVPISVVPTVKRRARAKAPATDAEADRSIVAVVRSQRASRRVKPVAITFGPHPSSPYVVRMDGAVARRKQDVRHAFHRSMHRWESPMLDGVGLDRVIAFTSDLWVEALDDEFFHHQFTPGDADVARQEAERGIWSRLRRPFVRWTDVGAARLGDAPQTDGPAAAEAFSVQDGDEEQGGSTFVVEPVSERAVEGLPEIVAPDDGTIAFMPSVGAPEAAAPWSARAKFWTRLGQWRVRAKERVEDLREEEQLLVSDAESAWRAPYLEPNVRIVRVVFGFLGMLCLVALPAGAVSWSRSVSHSVDQARRTAASVVSADIGDPRAVSEGFVRVQTVAQDIDRSHGLALALAQALPTTKDTAGTVRALLETAEEASAAGALLAKATDRIGADDISKPDERIVRLLQYLDEAQPHLDRLFAAAARLEPDALPPELAPRVGELRSQLLAYQPLVGQVRTLGTLALSVLGHDHARTYLVLFQNDAERRPSGGFMGSYAQVTFDRGDVRKLDVPGGGPYGLRSQLLERWRPPAPLQLVGARWEFQDANWFPDFAQTADTVRTFWSRSGQPTLDGVIAVNASLLPKLLALTGPIALPAYGKTVDADNVLLETQKAVELEYDRSANTPKAFVGDLNREVLARLRGLPRDRWLALAGTFAKALDTKEVQVRLFRPEEQETLRAFGWTGEWASAADGFDELALVGANIAGQKTDAVIDERLDQDVWIDAQGFVRNDLALRRRHDGRAGELFRGANNVEYLRVYAPAGAVLTAAQGFQAPSSSYFEIPSDHEKAFPGLATSTSSVAFGGQAVDLGEEQGRSVFGGWVQLRPGSAQETTYSYRLARSTADMARALIQNTDAAAADGVSDAYVLRLTSQSGAFRAHTVRIHYPEGWTVKKQSASLRAVARGTLEVQIPALDQDQVLYVLFHR